MDRDCICMLHHLHLFPFISDHPIFRELDLHLWVPILIFIGPLGILAGLLTIYGAKVKSPPQPPASCKKEAAELLAGWRALDGPGAPVEVRFDENGLSVSAGEDRETVPYGDMTGIFGTERLWLLVYGGERALLLQKKDLVSGGAERFLPYVLDKLAT